MEEIFRNIKFLEKWDMIFAVVGKQSEPWNSMLIALSKVICFICLPLGFLQSTKKLLWDFTETNY